MSAKIKFIRLFTGLFTGLIAVQLSAQERQPAGVIRGVVTDVASGQTLPSATVVILDSGTVIGTVADNNGNFRLGHVNK